MQPQCTLQCKHEGEERNKEGGWRETKKKIATRHLALTPNLLQYARVAIVVGNDMLINSALEKELGKVQRASDQQWKVAGVGAASACAVSRLWSFFISGCGKKVRDE